MKVFNWLLHTSIHKFWIFIEVSKFCFRLLYRALIHDLSKYSLIEVKGYSKLLPKLKNTTYGSDEYKSLLKELKPILDHHYKNNPHHPEFFSEGIEGMHLLDVVEMFIDWRVSTRKHANGDLSKSLEINKKRFNMSDQLESIFRNSL